MAEQRMAAPAKGPKKVSASEKRRAAAALELIAPNPNVHKTELYDLLGKVFSYNGYYHMRDWCRYFYIDHSHYDWQNSRIGLIDGRIVTHYGVWDYPMRIGSAVVRVGGIGAVATDGDFLKRGLMDKTARAAVDAMAASGYDMTILFGIDNFYHRFGYVRAWDMSYYSIPVAELPKERPTVRLQPFKVVQRDDVDEMANREQEGLTGTAVRPLYRNFYYPRMNRKGVLWRDAKKRLAGYVIYEQVGKSLEVAESGGDVEQGLRAMRAVAEKCNCDMVRFQNTLHYNSPIARRLRRMNTKIETNIHANGGPMIRTLHLDETLRKMEGELAKRLAASPLAAWKGTFSVADPREKVVLEIGKGKVTVAKKASGPVAHSLAGGEHVAQLLIGTNAPMETVEESGMTLKGDAAALVTALFPEQHPMIRVCDEY